MLIAYTDGSYNKDTGVYGGGGVLLDQSGNEVQRFSITGKPGPGEDGWNVNGELAAALEAIRRAKEVGCDSLLVMHDYEGVGYWPDGVWKARKTYTRDYASKVGAYRKEGLQITFEHVKGHSGDKWNDVADQLAKQGAGMGKDDPGDSDVNVNVNDIDAVGVPGAVDATDHEDAQATDRCRSKGSRPEEGPVSDEEAKKPYKVNDACKRAVRSFYKKKKPCFRDFMGLKTGGRDGLSSLKGDKLFDAAEQHHPGSVEIIRTGIHSGSETDLMAGLRWMLRGLRPEDAAHKVNVDCEVRENAIGARTRRW